MMMLAMIVRKNMRSRSDDDVSYDSEEVRSRMMMLAMIVRKNMRSRSDDDVSYDSEEEHEEQK